MRRISDGHTLKNIQEQLFLVIFSETPLQCCCFFHLIKGVFTLALDLWPAEMDKDFLLPQ